MLRFAVSPIGDMHINQMRVALINYIVAKQRNDGFILRIEDLNKDESGDGKEGEIQEILKKFAIEADQTIYQSEHIHRYRQLALNLIRDNKAFLCKCKPEDIEAEKESARKEERPYRYSRRCLKLSSEDIKEIQDKKIPYVIRIKKPENDIRFTDLIRGETVAKADDIDSFVILDRNGNPSPDFASAVDDMLGGVTTVIREEEHLESTPKQIHILKSLGFEQDLEFAHLPAITDGKELNGEKYENIESIPGLLKEGFIPDAIINYLLLLGNKTPKEIFNLPDAIKWFDIKNISQNPDYFDLNKLREINKKHLKEMDSKMLSRIFGFSDAEIGELLKIYLKEAGTINELQSRLDSIFSPKPCSGKWENEMKKLAPIIADAPFFNDFDEFKAYLTKQSGLKEEYLLKPMQLLMTGTEKGPELNNIYPILKPYLLEVAKCQH